MSEFLCMGQDSREYDRKFIQIMYAFLGIISKELDDGRMIRETNEFSELIYQDIMRLYMHLGQYSEFLRENEN